MEKLFDRSEETTGTFDKHLASASDALLCGVQPRLLLRVEEAADQIGICRSNMFKLIREGDVQSVKVGRLRRITPAALEDYIRRLCIREDSAA